jgi:hypothetical protein
LWRLLGFVPAGVEAAILVATPVPEILRRMALSLRVCVIRVPIMHVKT